MTRLSTASLILMFALTACGTEGTGSSTKDGGKGGGSAGTGGGAATGGGTAGTGGGSGSAGGAGGGTTGVGGGSVSGTGGGTTGGVGGGTAAGGGAGGGTGTGGGSANVVLPDGGTVSGAMSFFVTSRGTGTGGDLRNGTGDGLLGADAFCKTLATAVSPAIGAKTWKAYLSTATVNARTRIGAGPWVNAKGVQIAANLAQLHGEAGDNVVNAANTLTEVGSQVPLNPNVHDILSGTETNGTVAANQHCINWTSTAANGASIARVGHANRAGGGDIPTSWQSAHESTGCAPPPAPGGNAAGTVASGGGRGSFYCFSAN